MRERLRVAWVVGVGAVMGGVIGVGPATRPGLEELLRGLDSVSGGERDAAFQQLLDMRLSDVNGVREALRARGGSATLSAAQGQGLRAAAVHWFVRDLVAGMPADPTTAKGVVGIKLGESTAVQTSAGEVSGVEVITRSPGYPGYAMLRDHDVIFAAAGKVSFPDRSDFQSALDGMTAGREIELGVMRDGRELHVRLTLGKRPEGFNDPTFEDGLVAMVEPMVEQMMEVGGRGSTRASTRGATRGARLGERGARPGGASGGAAEGLGGGTGEGTTRRSGP